jgi:hypothetical protein
MSSGKTRKEKWPLSQVGADVAAGGPAGLADLLQHLQRPQQEAEADRGQNLSNTPLTRAQPRENHIANVFLSLILF